MAIIIGLIGQSRSLAVEIISIRTLPQAVETDTQSAKMGYRKPQHRQHTIMLYFAQSIDLLARHCLLCIPLLRSFVPRLLVFLVSYAQIVAKRPRQVIELIDELRGLMVVCRLRCIRSKVLPEAGSSLCSVPRRPSSDSDRMTIVQTPSRLDSS